MQADNMKIWSAVEHTDKAATKQFKRAGGFNGTAIKPMYQYKRATETFGPCGIGWGWRVVGEQIVEGVHICQVELWFKWNGETGTITHYGATTIKGTRTDYQTKKTVEFVDEEFAKKSLTDALAKCLSCLGFSADIHMGAFDGNKYDDPAPPSPRPSATTARSSQIASSVGKAANLAPSAKKAPLPNQDDFPPEA